MLETDATPTTLIAEVHALPGKADEVRNLLSIYGKVVRAEPGNEIFACHQVEGEPERFIVYEVYKNRAGFEAHIGAPENAALNAKLKPLVKGSGSILTFLSPPR